MMKTWLCAIGAALLLALALAGCRQEGNDPSPGSTGEQQETAAQSDALRGMLRGRLGELQLVRSDTMNSGEVSIVLAFRQAAQDAAGEELKLVTDFEYAYPVQAFELVIGSTGREGTHFSLPQGEALPAGAYRVDIVEQRVILSYSDRDGMKNGLEYLLLAMVEADESALKSSFADALLERGLRRYDSFVLSNAFVDGMKLPASADTPCIGLSDPGSTVSALLYDGETLLREVTAQTDADGTWSLSLPAETEADRLLFAVNGANMERFTGISWAGSILGSPSGDMRIYINGVEQPVFESDAGLQVIASQSSPGETLQVTVEYPFRNVVVRPLSAGVEPQTESGRVSFQVEQLPAKLSVEFDGDPTDSVQLFLYGYDPEPVPQPRKGLLYFPPGEYHYEENIVLSSDQTVYLAEGALLHARFEATGAENIAILGRGIIDTYAFPVETRMLNFTECKNITLRDFSLIGPRSWMVVLVDCDDCLLDGVNVIGTAINSDGVDIVGSRNVTVQSGFFRNNDDCIAIKSWGRDVQNVRICGNVFWNDLYGNGLEIGYETRCESISDIVFEDNDIIHVIQGATMSIHLGDRASVSNVRFRDIRVEDSDGLLVEMFIRETNYSQDAERGHIRDVTIEDIQIVGGQLGGIAITGYDAEHRVEEVSVSGITYLGEPLLTFPQELLTLNAHTANIRYEGSLISE